MEANVAKHKTSLDFMVKILAGGLVDFHQWVDGKRHLFEWALDHGRNRTCLGETKRMEDRLSGCPHKAFRVNNNNNNNRRPPPPSLFG